jgi:hypothetical protein
VCCAAETAVESHVTSFGPVLVHDVVILFPSDLEEIASVSNTFRVTGYSFCSPPQAVAANRTAMQAAHVRNFFELFTA